MTRYNSHMKNESKCSAHVKNMLEQPASARLNVSLTPDRRNDSYKRYVDFVDSCVDNNKVYKGKNETAGRPAGTRIMSKMIGKKEYFYVG